MNNELKQYLFLFGYIFAIALTVWTIVWGLPMIFTKIQGPLWKISIIIFILPILPMLPGLFIGSYNLLEVPKVYIYEFIDMYYAVFCIILYFPLVAAQTLNIVLIIVFIAVTLIIIILFFNLAFTGEGTSGVRKEDFILYITIFQFNILLLLGMQYLVMFFEKAGDFIEEETSSKLDLLIKLLRKRREKTSIIGKKQV